MDEDGITIRIDKVIKLCLKDRYLEGCNYRKIGGVMTVVIDGINAFVDRILVVGGLGTDFGADANLIKLVIDELIELVS